ncbi:MAG TPA: lytic transglycosylase domain-containing protein [Candidatus Polarisedimenticolia bacterium]|jgi:soluble lytic murein transglycosylase-like protein
MTQRFTRLLLVAAAAFLAGEARADIEVRRLEGESLFVSRPIRKPGTIAPSRQRGRGFVVPPGELVGLIADVSRRYEMDPSLITTVVGVESGFNHLAVSPKGARGLMQLMPTTARQYGVRDVHDARENLEGGVAYLKDLLRRYNGDLKLALAAYNAGPQAVEHAAGVPNYRETRDYLQRIESRYGGNLGPATGEGAIGATAPRRANGPIHATRDRDGTIVATNVGGKRGRIVRRPAAPRP